MKSREGGAGVETKPGDLHTSTANVTEDDIAAITTKKTDVDKSSASVLTCREWHPRFVEGLRRKSLGQCPFIFDMQDFLKQIKNNKWIVNTTAVLLLVALFLAPVFLMGANRPPSPIDDSHELTAETMSLAGSNDDVADVEGLADEGEQKENENGGQQNEPEEPEEERKEGEYKRQNSTSGNSDHGPVTIEDGKGGLDGITDSDKATDKKGNGRPAKESVKPKPDDDSWHIVTDLKNADITEKQLPDAKLDFRAYIANPEEDMILRVNLFNGETPMNGRWLKSDNNKDYEANLAFGKNTITLFVKKGTDTIQRLTYVINYLHDMADEDNPEVGPHPPTIESNLDTIKETKLRNFIMTVRATDYKGNSIPYDNMIVTFDGKKLGTPTGNGLYEYDLYFQNPEVGDETHHTITVLAWDNEGNSRFKKYEITYHYIDTGDKIGECTVVVDLTTIGLGIVASGGTFDVKQDVPASYIVLEALEEYGFEPIYSGTPDIGFYLRGISRGYLKAGANPPQNLWDKIIDDGLTLNGSGSRDRLVEFDYTQGSGFMYTIDGVNYPGRGLSNYYLDGQNNTITIRFTLAFGKDLGQIVTNPPTALSTYCGVWINGGYEPRHRFGEETVIREATCTEEGAVARTCQVVNCGYHEDEHAIPALGHNEQQVARVEPQPGVEGYVDWQCTRCGTTRREILPALAHDHNAYKQEIARQEPQIGIPGWIRYRCALCNHEWEEVLEALQEDPQDPETP